MTAPNSITAIQDSYVKKVIDTLNYLPNVVWIVSEEAPSGSAWWHNHMIDLVRSYESVKPQHHPVGMATLESISDSTVINTNADWMVGGSKISPTTSCGSGTPTCKANINDSDHSYVYDSILADSPQARRNYFWENFTQGIEGVLFMDPYTVYYPRLNRNLCLSPLNGICSGVDTQWNPMRATMGYVRDYAGRMNLIAMTPQPNLSSTAHVLANTNPSSAEFLVYTPSGGAFTVNLSRDNVMLSVEWMNPATGAKTAGANVSGGTVTTFTPPFSGDAVLYLKTIGGG